MISDTAAPKQLHKNETLKRESNFLRGTILEGLADTTTGAISADDTQLIKFHGMYQQDDRDVRNERRKQKLDKAYMFMARIRVPGGVCTPEQWLALDECADKYANGTLKATTRQAFQFHGLLKHNLKSTLKRLNQVLMNSIAACGDINRNIMCAVLPERSEAHAAAMDTTLAINNHLLPRTRAYYEIWLDEEKVAGNEEEPLYGPTYLPRKFKVGVVVPPDNDIDVFTQDLGYIAITDESGKLIGYNVTAGGGMGMTHGNKETFPALGHVLGYIKKEDAVAIAEAVMTTQRDFGDRVNRAHARLKYTILDMGVDVFRKEVEQRSGIKFEQERPYKFTSTGEPFGWLKGTDGKWYYNLYVLSGRIKDVGDVRYKSGLREIAKIHDGDFRLTGNQNVVIGKISEENKPKVEALLEEYGIANGKSRKLSGLRLHSLSCVALPTCGLALAESERALPGIIDRLEEVIEEAGLSDQAITMRITGCPNGCARPYNSEIGLVGRAPGKYNLYLGAKLDGTRMSKLYKDSITVDQVIQELRPIISRYAQERQEGEEFGEFVIRKDYVKPTAGGPDFHANVNL